MGLDTEFSPNVRPAKGKKLWDAKETLGIINTDPGYQCITCVGYAPTKGRRCRMQIRANNREFISATIDEISYLDPGSPAVALRLRAIAGPALCVRFHQNQVEAVMKKWQQTIKQVQQQAAREKPTKPIQSTRKENLEPVKEQIREIRQLLRELQEDLNGQRQYEQTPGWREQSGRGRQEEKHKRWSREESDREARRQEREEEARKLADEEAEENRKRQKEGEEKKERDRKQAADNERIRQKAQRVREENERKKFERERKEREEWDESWATYQSRWVQFRASTSRVGDIGDAIPWPVKSHSRRDAVASAVEEFMKMAIPRDADVAKLMRKECQKWHPDKLRSWLRDAKLTEVDKMIIDMICRVVTEILNETAGRSSEFLS